MNKCQTCYYWAKWYSHGKQTSEGACSYNGKPMCVNHSRYKPKKTTVI